jgi:hypothetical protein
MTAYRSIYFLYRMHNVSFTPIKHQAKDNLPDEIIEEYTYSFSIFSHVTDADNRKMQSSSSFVYVCFACYHLVTPFDHQHHYRLLIKEKSLIGQSLM